MSEQGRIALSAVEMAARIRDGSMTAEAAVTSALEKAHAADRTLNCFCFLYDDEALALARQADRQRASGATLGPLHGVPVAIKDFTPMRGKVTTRGSKAFEHWVPDYDPVIVRRLRAAGAIVIGKTTTPELAYDSFTQSPLWGVTVNPWNPAKTPGGSSGGSAAAVAVGCVPLAEGTDMGGSVRIPASFCGIVGLKPSLGRIPMDILPTVFDQISHFGPLARTVEDAALFLEVTAGPDEVDIQSLPVGAGAEPSLPEDHRDWRIGLSVDLGYYAVDQEVADNLERAADALRAVGATVEPIRLPWDRTVNDAWFAYWGVLLAAGFGDVLERFEPEMDPNVVTLMRAGLGMDAVSFKRIEMVRTRQWHGFLEALGDRHALLCPTMAKVAPDTGLSDSDFGGTDAAGRFEGLDMTCPFNFIGQCPAISVPSGFGWTGLPTGAQLVGRRFDDAGLLRIARAMEDALDLDIRCPEPSA
jgi:Asp-tRNA(Asn)/Glu-tRNA(Gln) amidotransferase A subunit family amidase